MALAARARGAILGSLVADAAAVPVHWCYDPEKLAEHLKQACQAAWFRLFRLMDFFVRQNEDLLSVIHLETTSTLHQKEAC